MPRSAIRNRDAVRFGAILTRLRNDRGWTLVKLAQRSGMNPTYLGVLEKGGNLPSLTTILELADVFNVDAGDLIREVAQARRQPRAKRTPAATPGE